MSLDGIKICSEQIILPLVGKTEHIFIENDDISVAVLREFGGKISSIYNKKFEQEFLWFCPEKLKRNCQVFDDCFAGGIDEVIPNDLPEMICGIDFPDHGVLWSKSLECQIAANSIIFSCELIPNKLKYKKEMTISDNSAKIENRYEIENISGEIFPFLWKMHAAIKTAPGDRIYCPAAKAVSIDPLWSRSYSKTPFNWPYHPSYNADVLPQADGTTEFLFLYELKEGVIEIIKETGFKFAYHFDMNIFPYICYFASYGGMGGIYTAVIEPCTAMPVSVNEAAKLNQCSKLNPGEKLSTTVIICADKC